MEFIRTWAMQVAGAVVFGILCEMLAPEGKLKSIVRIVLGLVVVVAVINPFMSIADRDLLLGELTFIDNLTLTNELETLETRTALINAYKNRLQNEIVPQLSEVADGFNVDVQLEVNTAGDIGTANFGDITEVQVMLTSQGGEHSDNFENVINDITAILNNNFGVANEKIQIWRIN